MEALQGKKARGTGDGSPSAAQLQTVLDHEPVAVFVSDLATHKLLYVNRLAAALFSGKQAACCYQVKGFDRPCPFCHTGEMGRDRLQVREYRHPADGRVYQISGKIIDWGDTPAHIEYIADITEQKGEARREEQFKRQLEEVFSSVPCGLCVYRARWPQVEPVFHNPAFYEVTGYSSEHIRAVTKSTDYLGVHPADKPALLHELEQVCKRGGALSHTYRLWNDKRGEYRWIRLEGTAKLQKDGSQTLYGVYTDVSERMRLAEELTQANQKMQSIINAIPGGVALYKAADRFETSYFSDGLPELLGYSRGEYKELVQNDMATTIYPEDAGMVAEQLHRALQEGRTADFEFRQVHRDGHIVWVHVQARQVGRQEGCPLLQCVFHNISALKETQLEMDHVVNSIPGGIASYQVEGEHFVPIFYSEGVLDLTGHTRAEFDQISGEDALNVIYGPDRARVQEAAKAALLSGGVLDVSYRVRHKDGHLLWVHLRGRRMGPLSETPRFYAVFTGMTDEARLFESIANESVDGIYVVGRENYDLLYVNESKEMFGKGRNFMGRKCYEALHGRAAPCEFCSLHTHAADGQEHPLRIPGDPRVFTTRFRETDWNGIPAYIRYVRDVTEEDRVRLEKERLEQYFQTLVRNLPGGVAVMRCKEDGPATPEFLSEGFAEMTDMTLGEAWELYRQDAMAGVHPEDRDHARRQMEACMAAGQSTWELDYRLRRGQNGYLWVRNTLSVIHSDDGVKRVYSMYHDITREREEQENARRQYDELLQRYSRRLGPDTLLVVQCDITRGKILSASNFTGRDLMAEFGDDQDVFFTRLAENVEEEAEKRALLSAYRHAPLLAAFEQGKVELAFPCFIRLPGERVGRYVHTKGRMITAPDTGAVTGIITVEDVTEQVMMERALHKVSVTGYDFVVEVDLLRDRYNVLAATENGRDIPLGQGCHSQRVEEMLRDHLLPRDRELYRRNMDPAYMLPKLREKGSYTFAFSIADADGAMRTKNMTISAVDLRLGRICLCRTDITASVRQQQSLLRVIAYTFEMAAFIDLSGGNAVLHTRETVQQGLPPYTLENCETAILHFLDIYGEAERRDEARSQLDIGTMRARLAQTPQGYDLLFDYDTDEGEGCKQINVLWGDENHNTICMVRADVTDVMAAERQTQKSLEQALALAEEANAAKSDFLSAMSHDIRTPMNAIMGMTALAQAHLSEPERVEDYLQKIAVSSRHLLSLINDVLDMSKIERAKIKLNRLPIDLGECGRQLDAMMQPQAQSAGVALSISVGALTHGIFYGDPLRVNQILINLVSNAIKFTPRGGRVEVRMEEIPPCENTARARYRLTVADTGIGMDAQFLGHIFEPFTRGAGVDRIEGTGLGLSITKGLIDLMGGTIQVESTPGRGTEFQVELSADPTEPAEETSRAASGIGGEKDKAPLAGRRFLVAEDNAINAEILCGLLELYGAESLVEPNGAQAVEAFSQARPGAFDAILMDIQMPVMNGYDATRTIRELARKDAKTVPIIAMTANAFAEDVQAALEAGMTAHVAKPIDTSVLCSTLVAALRQ